MDQCSNALNFCEIKPVDDTMAELIQEKINAKIKPLGSLGKLEGIAKKISLIELTRMKYDDSHNNAEKKILLSNPYLLVFAGDHGIAEEGVSITNSHVTTQMVESFLQGKAAVNSFCRLNGVHLRIVDSGMKNPVSEPTDLLIEQRVGMGTKNFAREPAMTMSQANQCLYLGMQAANHVIDQGCDLLALGEMGIGNTTSASAIMGAVTGLLLKEYVGRGSGISDRQLKKKFDLILQGLSRFSERDPLNILMQVGGFEIGQLVGAILGAASRQIPIVIDGFIVSSAAMLAAALDSHVKEYLIFSHSSHESGHRYMLEYLKAEPLLQLDLRLGEGTGAALAVPLIFAAKAFFNEMAELSELNMSIE